MNLYRLQRSWGKVIFSEACVKNSVHIREQCMLGDTGNKRAVCILLECILVKQQIGFEMRVRCGISIVLLQMCVLYFSGYGRFKVI